MSFGLWGGLSWCRHDEKEVRLGGTVNRQRKGPFTLYRWSHLFNRVVLSRRMNGVTLSTRRILQSREPKNLV